MASAASVRKFLRARARKAAPAMRRLRATQFTCVYCGCTDARACKGGCCWILKFPKLRAGICSQCDRRALNDLVKAINHADTPVVLTELGRSFFVGDSPVVSKPLDEYWMPPYHKSKP